MQRLPARLVRLPPRRKQLQPVSGRILFKYQRLLCLHGLLGRLVLSHCGLHQLHALPYWLQQLGQSLLDVHRCGRAAGRIPSKAALCKSIQRPLCWCVPPCCRCVALTHPPHPTHPPTDCAGCNPGYGSADGTQGCSICPAGTYSQGDFEAVCSPCPQYKYSDAAGAEQCTDCPADSWNTGTGNTGCRGEPTAAVAWHANTLKGVCRLQHGNA